MAFATPNTPNAKLHEIDIVKDWGPQMGNHDKIPSVISYSPTSRAGEQQWGASISPDAVTMVNTKLELDVQDNKSDELDLILQVLDGMNNLNFDHVAAAKGYPDYTWKVPEDIVTDYLTKVFQYLDEAVAHFGAELRAKIPVDIVLTVPVVSPLFFSFKPLNTECGGRHGHTWPKTPHIEQFGMLALMTKHFPT